MADPVLQGAYDAAATVLSRSLRFVEWKLIIASPAGSAPFGDAGEPRHKAIKPIDRVKWIYVFRHNVGDKFAELRDEIRIDAAGNMAATRLEDLNAEASKRKQQPIGKTLCLPRRVFGKPSVYRFYASRVQLPSEQIRALEKTVYTFLPATNLELGKNTSVVEKNGELLVPVVDPITVALHLHAAFSAAADDVINYTHAHKDLPEAQRKAVARRRKKQLLASFLKSIIGEEKNVSANNLVHQLKGQQGPLEDFLVHYEAQLQWRIARRERLALYLTRWLKSDAMKIAAAAHQAAHKDAWPQFLVPWCHAVTRLCETVPGREYLLGVLGDPAHFAKIYVWPEKEPPENAIQAIRKGGMTLLEAWKTFAEARVLVKGGDYVAYVTDTVSSLRKLRRYKLNEKLTPQSIKEAVGIDKKIKATFLLDPDDFKPQHHFSSGARSLGAFVESVNFIISVRSTMDAIKDPQEREQAIIGLVGSGLDATSAIAALFKSGEKLAAVLGFVSGVIDIYLGAAEMNRAYTDGDQDIANGAFLTAAGATFGTASVAMGLLAIPGAQAVAILGLAIVAAGYIYKLLKGKEPLERFFGRCSWGVDYLKPGGGKWSRTRFETWKGDNEFDYQIDALLNIICKIEINRGATFRDMKISVAWLPPRASLTVKYEELWKGAAQPHTLETVLTMNNGAPVSKKPVLAASLEGKNVIKVQPAAGQLPAKTLYGETQSMGVARVRSPHADLKSSVVSVRLFVTFDGMAALSVPHDGPVKSTVTASTLEPVKP